MVQAAQHAKSVVKSEQTRGALVPMTASQIAALAQQRAMEIVSHKNSRRSSSSLNDISDSSRLDRDAQVQIQAQALDHAYTQAQIRAGTYQGDDAVDVSSPAGMVVQTSVVAAGGVNATPASESTPLLGNARGGGGSHAVASIARAENHPSWLRKLNAGVLLSIVVVLVVHYTNQSKDYNNKAFEYHVYGISGNDGSSIRAPVGGAMVRKSSAQMVGASLDAKEKIDVGNGADGAIGSSGDSDVGTDSKAFHEQQAMVERVETSTSLVSDAAMPTKNKQSAEPSKQQEKREGTPVRASTQENTVQLNAVADGPAIVATAATPPPPAPSAMWSKMASMFTPVASVAIESTFRGDDKRSDGIVAGDNHMNGAASASAASATDAANKDATMAASAPTLSSTPADPQVAEEYFAGLLVDHEAFFFPFDMVATDKKDKKHRFLRQNHRMLHRHNRHDHHDHHNRRQATNASETRTESMLWSMSLNKKSESKDAAAVSAYYQSKGNSLMMDDASMGTPLDLPIDWEVDVNRRRTLGETYGTIADLIDQHYQQAYGTKDAGEADRRRLKKNKKSAAEEMYPIDFDPQYTWMMDTERGQELSRLYGLLSRTVQDHYDEFGGTSADDKDDANDLMTSQGQAVAELYQAKSAAIQKYYDSDGGIPSTADGVAAADALDTAQDGHMVEDYYQAIYDPVSYNQDLLALLPATNPNKIYGEWGHDWRNDREHGKALDEYWAQYNSVMDDYYKEQGEALSKQYQDYYNGQFRKTTTKKHI
jgi:hypothetical protein